MHHSTCHVQPMPGQCLMFAAILRPWVGCFVRHIVTSLMPGMLSMPVRLNSDGRTLCERPFELTRMLHLGWPRTILQPKVLMF